MSDRRRRLSALSWFVVAAVLVRAASGGGGGLGGIMYFAEREPPLSYAAGAVLLAISLTLVLAFVRPPSAALPVVSAVMAIPTVAFSYFALPGHESAVVLGAAAIGAFGLAAPAARRQLAGRRLRSASQEEAEAVEPDR